MSALTTKSNSTYNFSPLANHANKIDHVAIAVHDLEKAITYYSEIGFRVSERIETHGEKSGMISAVMIAGPITFVLLQGVDEKSQISRFITEYGPGPQHIAIEVQNCEQTCEELAKQGLKFGTDIIKGPTLTQRFSKRCTNSGVMLEFIERHENASESEFSERNVTDLFRQLEKDDNF